MDLLVDLLIKDVDLIVVILVIYLVEIWKLLRVLVHAEEHLVFKLINNLTLRREKCTCSLIRNQVMVILLRVDGFLHPQTLRYLPLHLEDFQGLNQLLVREILHVEVLGLIFFLITVLASIVLRYIFVTFSLLIHGP